jgi:hypothetical protein
MHRFALVILLVATVPAWASGPKTVVKAEPKPQYDDINLVGWQRPKLRLPAPPFISRRELITLLRPDVEIASRLLGFDLPRSGFSNTSTEVLQTVRDEIFPNWGGGRPPAPPPLFR